ncbi:MAG: NifB/NifX family molybdenum-iron cluster-binding protein [Candidatus Bathyarchaeota archaeon]|nr:NifB/NifX family molybdenum-iron cluster-binding protein [Candidatus Bathyarchaeota archaeon]
MKVAVSSTGRNLESAVDPRFGRCPYFVVVDTETMAFEAVPNTSVGVPHGAGIVAAQLVASLGAKAVLTGNVGPNAFSALSAAGLQVLTGVSGSIREAVERFKRGELVAGGGPTVGGHFGLGGRGRGRGGRRRT